MRLVLRTALPGIVALLIACDAWAEPSYQDGNWGVVPQDGGRACIIVLNSEDGKHAFHFLVDGEQNAATIGILDDFLPSSWHITASTTISLELGPRFARRLEFERRFEGSVSHLTAELPPEDFDAILEALGSRQGGVSLSFENGEKWRVPPPNREAASAIAQCWNEALSGLHA